MVRLVKGNDTKLVTDLVTTFFNYQKHHTHVVPVNFPDVEPCLYAMWHCQQCAVSGLPNKTNTNVHVSKSNDGQVVGDAIERAFGFKTIRGSHAHDGAVGATMQMLEALKRGENIAVMVDGPRGPIHVVKKGIIKVAKMSGRPIVPLVWYSPNFNLVRLKSWDRLQMPVCCVNLINLYGEPMYVPADGDNESDERCRLALQNKLLELDEQAPVEYEKVYWHGLWRRRK